MIPLSIYGFVAKTLIRYELDVAFGRWQNAPHETLNFGRKHTKVGVFNVRWPKERFLLRIFKQIGLLNGQLNWFEKNNLAFVMSSILIESVKWFVRESHSSNKLRNGH